MCLILYISVYLHMVVKVWAIVEGHISCCCTTHFSKKRALYDVVFLHTRKSCFQIVPSSRPPTMHDPNDETWGCLWFNDVILTGYFRVTINIKSIQISVFRTCSIHLPFGHRDIIESNTFSPIVLTNSQTDIKNDHGRSMSLPLFMRIAVWWVQLLQSSNTVLQYTNATQIRSKILLR